MKRSVLGALRTNSERVDHMGGRGGASGATKGGGNYSYRTEGTAGNHQKEANAVIMGAKSVLSDFGMESELTSIYFSDRQVEAAGMDGYGGLTISKPYLAKGRTSSNGYLVNDTFEGTGTHEAGHLVAQTLLTKKVIPNATLLEKADARQKNKLEKAILKEAKKRYGSNPAISGYGSKNAGEKIAEAVSDVYSNRKKSNPYSRVIVSVMKDINSGKFIPKI